VPEIESSTGTTCRTTIPAPCTRDEQSNLPARNPPPPSHTLATSTTRQRAASPTHSSRHFASGDALEDIIVAAHAYRLHQPPRPRRPGATLLSPMLLSLGEVLVQRALGEGTRHTRVRHAQA
jgi:hypothetical protein